MKRIGRENVGVKGNLQDPAVEESPCVCRELGVDGTSVKEKARLTQLDKQLIGVSKRQPD